MRSVKRSVKRSVNLKNPDIRNSKTKFATRDKNVVLTHFFIEFAKIFAII